MTTDSANYKTPLLFFTFNCAKTKQPTAVINDALTAALSASSGSHNGNTSDSNHKPALVAIGLEEVAPIMDSCFSDTALYLAPIEAGVLAALGGEQEYKQCSKTIVGAVVLLTYHHTKTTKVTKVVEAGVRCGMLLSGLKGGAGVRLTLLPASTSGGATGASEEEDKGEEFTIVNAHLAANEGYASARNADFYRIATGLEFGDGYGLYKPGSHTFFMGDLNYRATAISASASSAGEASERLLGGSAFDRDELTHEVHNRRVLFGFEEAAITFKPTYKYLVGSTTDYKPNRTPSWCDRILYLPYSTSAAEDVQVHAYACLPSVTTSDHKPVYLSLSVPSGVDGPLSVFETSSARARSQLLLKRTLGHEVSLKPDWRAPYLESVGSWCDWVIGYAVLAVSTTGGRIGIAAGMVLLLVVFYFA